jgi:alkylated DNA repair dioxygenase AlkB
MPPITRKTIRPAEPPQGFVYRENFIALAEQAKLINEIEKLPLKEFEFHGYLGKRRTMSFGWHYRFDVESLNQVEPIPEFLMPLRERAAALAGLGPDNLPHVLVTEYSPGTPIGWHRDKGVFDEVIGVSLLSSCPFRLRRKTKDGWERFTQSLAPRSVYILRGDVRTTWEHSIPPVGSLSYSITFRSLR